MKRIGGWMQQFDQMQEPWRIMTFVSSFFVILIVGTIISGIYGNLWGVIAEIIVIAFLLIVRFRYQRAPRR